MASDPNPHPVSPELELEIEETPFTPQRPKTPPSSTPNVDFDLDYEVDSSLSYLL